MAERTYETNGAIAVETWLPRDRARVGASLPLVYGYRNSPRLLNPIDRRRRKFDG
ncbi:MAG: hypothetical protein ACSLFQ_01650 [Thermoanaerobaculia bacterium]